MERREEPGGMNNTQSRDIPKGYGTALAGFGPSACIPERNRQRLLFRILTTPPNISGAELQRDDTIIIHMAPRPHGINTGIARGLGVADRVPVIAIPASARAFYMLDAVAAMVPSFFF